MWCDFHFSDLYSRPKILAIPTRYDSEYVWTATSDSLTVRFHKPILLVSFWHQHILYSCLITILKLPKALSTRMLSVFLSLVTLSSPNLGCHPITLPNHVPWQTVHRYSPVRHRHPRHRRLTLLSRPIHQPCRHHRPRHPSPFRPCIPRHQNLHLSLPVFLGLAVIILNSVNIPLLMMLKLFVDPSFLLWTKNMLIQDFVSLLSPDGNSSTGPFHAHSVYLR